MDRWMDMDMYIHIHIHIHIHIYTWPASGLNRVRCDSLQSATLTNSGLRPNSCLALLNPAAPLAFSA